MPRRRRFASRAGAGLHNSALRTAVGGTAVVNVSNPVTVDPAVVNVSNPVTVGGTTVITGVGGEAGVYTRDSEVAAGDLVELESTDTVRRARPDAANPKRIVGIVLSIEGTTCAVQYAGEVTLSGLTPEARYYAGSLGTIQTSAPTTGMSKLIGIAKSDTVLLLVMAESIHKS